MKVKVAASHSSPSCSPWSWPFWGAAVDAVAPLSALTQLASTLSLSRASTSTRTRSQYAGAGAAIMRDPC